MSSVRLLRASSLLLQQTRSSGGPPAAFPHSTKKLCPLLASPNSLVASKSSLSSFSSLPSASPSSRSPFLFRAYTTTAANEGDSDTLESSEEDTFNNDSDDSDDPFNTSDDDWFKEQESEVEESELELGGRTIPAKRKPYPKLETDFLIRHLKKQIDKVKDEGLVKESVKDFLESKNNEKLNAYVEDIDKKIAESIKKTGRSHIETLEELKALKEKENARLAALPKPFDWVPDVEDTGPVYDPARSGYGIYPPVMAPVAEVADFYLRLYPPLYPFRDVIVYKMMMKVIEISEWYDHTIPHFSGILKRGKDLGLFQHFSGLDDEESLVREIAASQGLTLEEWGNADFQVKALKHQRAACFWEPPFDTMNPTMVDLDDLVTALEKAYPGETPIRNLEEAIVNCEDAADACARFIFNCKRMNEEIKSLNILPRQFAVQMENMLHPGMYKGYLPYADYRFNPWVQKTADGVHKRANQLEMQKLDRILGKAPSFVDSINEKMESIKIPKDADDEQVQAGIESFINTLSRNEVIEMQYMLSQPKDSKERRCLNYLSTFFESKPYSYQGEPLHSDSALLHLVDRQKMDYRSAAASKLDEDLFPFQNEGEGEGEGKDEVLEASGTELNTDAGEEDERKFATPDSAFHLSLTPVEAQYLARHGVTMDEMQDEVMDDLLLHVEKDMVNESSNIEDGFEWDRVLTEHRLAQAQPTQDHHDAHLDKSYRRRFPGKLFHDYREHMEKDDEMIDRKCLKPKEKNCMYCVMENPPKLDPWNVPFLRDLLDEVGNIRSRRETGFCPKHQRKLTPVLRRAVQLGFFSFKKGEFTVIDPFRPMPWKPVQHGLYPEDVCAAVELMEPEDAEKFMEVYKAQTPDWEKEGEEAVYDEEEDIENAQMRYVPGNHTFKKRKQTFPQWGK